MDIIVIKENDNKYSIIKNRCEDSIIKDVKFKTLESILKSYQEI